jgi:hypothetical protein
LLCGGLIFARFQNIENLLFFYYFCHKNGKIWEIRASPFLRPILLFFPSFFSSFQPLPRRLRAGTVALPF